MENKENRKNNKKIVRKIRISRILKLVLLILICFLIIFVFIKNGSSDKHEHSDGLIYNNNKSFLKKQTIQGVTFKNIKCSYDGKNSLISYIISNDTDELIDLSKYYVFVKDKNKNIITKIAANVSQKIKPKEEVKMANSVVGVDLSDAYYMELDLKINNE